MTQNILNHCVIAAVRRKSLLMNLEVDQPFVIFTRLIIGCVLYDIIDYMVSKFKNKHKHYNTRFHSKFQPKSIGLRKRFVHTVAVTLTNNNTFVNLSRIFYKVTSPANGIKRKVKNVKKLKSRTITYISGGLCAFKGTQKANPMANTTIGQIIAAKIKKLNIRKLTMFFYGRGKRKKEIVLGFTKYGFAFERLEHKTPVPYNGCRKKKLRRK